MLDQARQQNCANDFTEAIYATALEAAGRDDEAAALRQEKIAAGSRHPAFYANHAKWLLDKKDDANAALRVLDQARQQNCANNFTEAIYATALKAAGSLRQVTHRKIR